MKSLGFVLFLVGLLAAIGECTGFVFPTARWFFETSYQVPFLHFQSSPTHTIPWFGWLSAGMMIIGGGALIARSLFGPPPNPITLRRIKRFKAIKRGYHSLMILVALAGIASMDRLIVGKQAIAVYYQNHWVFPAFLPYELKNKDFQIADQAPDAPVNYRSLKQSLESSQSGRVILPPIPYDPTGDTQPATSSRLVLSNGKYCTSSGQPFFGLAARFYHINDAIVHIRQPMRDGLPHGPADGWLPDGTPVYTALWDHGVLVSDSFNHPSNKDDFLNQNSSEYRAIHYHPAPPTWAQNHLLGTTSQGYDVLAYLYGGLQVNFKAALIYLPIVYLIGITIGLLMGYFGGWFDMIAQRLIEIFCNIPFLFVIIIFASMVPDEFKGLPIIMTILIAFGWMGMTFLMRTAAYRDKERDYISAAKVMGASTNRVLFKHLLPNTISIVVTLVPFCMSGLVFSLTSLDYLGFGLPAEYATWGRLLNDGLANLSAPWLASSTFIVLVGLLVLITFIGEAVREAFDPKQFTFYR